MMAFYVMYSFIFYSYVQIISMSIYLKQSEFEAAGFSIEEAEQTIRALGFSIYTEPLLKTPFESKSSFNGSWWFCVQHNSDNI